MTEYIEYMGYKGSIKYSTADKCYYGQIINIIDLVTYEASSIEKLKIAFREAVRDYLNTLSSLK